MKHLLHVGCKSTFMVMLVVALSSVAMAQGKDSTSPRNVQQGNLYEAMKAQNISSTIHAEDLTTDWHMIANSSYQGLYPYYTLGNTLLFGGQEYLVAYQLVRSSDPDEREAQRYYNSLTTLTKQGRNTSMLLKGSLLSLSLLLLRQHPALTQLGRFDPTKDIAAGPPKILIERRKSQSNLKQIGLGIWMYMQDYNGKMPPMVAARSADDIVGSDGVPYSVETTAATPVQNRLMPYVKSKEIFLQPTTHRPYLPNYKVSRLSDSQIKNPSQQFLFYEDAPDADGMRNVVYADGHVKAIRENSFQYRRKAQHISESGYPSAAKPMPKAKATPKA